MTAQIYNPSRDMFHSFFMNKDPPYIHEFYLGDSIAWNSIKNTNNEFISLGGSKENPITYKYQQDGLTDFTFSIIGPNFPRVKDVNLSRCHYELWIDGVKPYYFYFDFVSELIFCRTISVIAKKDQITKFKFKITYLYTQPMDMERFLYFEGGPHTVYSSITAKFIPYAVQENNHPIVITEDSQLKLNRRYIVKAPFGKTLQLQIPNEATINDWIELKNMDAGSFQLNSGDNIDIIMNGLITRAKNGYIRARKRGDFIRLECMEKSPRIIFSDTINIGITSIVF